MINKQNLWFVTLFSLILILGIYYVSIDDEVKSVLKTEEIVSETPVIELTESDALVALEVEKEEEKQTLMEEYQDILLNEKSTIQEKNNAYENMQKINSSKTEEEKIQKIIEEKFKLKSVVKIKDDTIDPYMNFARKYPVRDSMRMMRLLYRLSIGSQDRKQEQMIMFSRTISNLQQKARETKYKNRLDKMENKTMKMLLSTGFGVMILLVFAVLQMMNLSSTLVDFFMYRKSKNILLIKFYGNIFLIFI